MKLISILVQTSPLNVDKVGKCIKLIDGPNTIRKNLVIHDGIVIMMSQQVCGRVAIGWMRLPRLTIIVLLDMIKILIRGLVNILPRQAGLGAIGTVRIDGRLGFGDGLAEHGGGGRITKVGERDILPFQVLETIGKILDPGELVLGLIQQLGHLIDAGGIINLRAEINR